MEILVIYFFEIVIFFLLRLAPHYSLTLFYQPQQVLLSQSGGGDGRAATQALRMYDEAFTGLLLGEGRGVGLNNQRKSIGGENLFRDEYLPPRFLVSASTTLVNHLLLGTVNLSDDRWSVLNDAWSKLLEDVGGADELRSFYPLASHASSFALKTTINEDNYNNLLADTGRKRQQDKHEFENALKVLRYEMEQGRETIHSSSLLYPLLLRPFPLFGATPPSRDGKGWTEYVGERAKRAWP